MIRLYNEIFRRTNIGKSQKGRYVRGEVAVEERSIRRAVCRDVGTGELLAADVGGGTVVGYVMARHLAGGEKDILRLATWHWERVLQPAHGCHPDRLDMIRVLAVCFASVQYILQTERERAGD
jgi:hypothetical protein